MKRISELDNLAHGDIQDTDLVEIGRPATKNFQFTWSSLKTALTTLFDTLYAALTHATRHQAGGADELLHKTQHQSGGADQISVAGLSGELVDNQPPKTHATTHQNTEVDEISVAGLSGELADDQPPKLGETSVLAYRGDRGKTAYDHSQAVTGAEHGAVSAATVNMIVRRDSNGRAKVVAPSDTDEIALLSNTLAVRGVDTKTDSYTFVLGDAGKLILMNHASAKAFTVPTNANVAFLTGTKIAIMAASSGEVTATAAGGVALNSYGNDYGLSGQWAGAVLIKIAENEWIIEGNLI